MKVDLNFEVDVHVFDRNSTGFISRYPRNMIMQLTYINNSVCCRDGIAEDIKKSTGRTNN